MNSRKTKKNITIEQMWSLIEETLAPLNSMPDKTKMNYEQVFKLYSIINEANEMFRMLKKIAILKKSIAKLSSE